MSIKHFLIVALGLVILTGCSSPKALVFADREWHVSGHYGQIIDKDTTYRLTFGDVLIPDPLTVISSADSIAKYPGMDRFVADILHTCGLDGGEILFYAPQMKSMFVRPPKAHDPGRPAAVSVPAWDDKLKTFYVTENDDIDWGKRHSDEIYTYTYYNKKKRQLLIVAYFEYGDSTLAQIDVLQTSNDMTRKMKIPRGIQSPFYGHDLRKYIRDVAFWSSVVQGRRRVITGNYKIGQDRRNGKK